MAQRNLKLTYPMRRGADVRWAQDRLLAHGFSPGATDGVFGPDTQRAVVAFQAAKGLDPDGIVGPLTRAALDAAAGGQAAPGESAAPAGDFIPAFDAWLRSQLGHIYIWGGQGEIVESESWIHRMETSTYNAQRAVRLYRKRREEGMDPIRAYDCSGLIMRYLQAQDVFSYDMSSASLYNKCRVIARDELRPGDLVFRHNGIRIYHVGVYLGGGEVIEAKGRDDGVVLRDIGASGAVYWNRYGRLMQIQDR